MSDPTAGDALADAARQAERAVIEGRWSRELQEYLSARLGVAIRQWDAQADVRRAEREVILQAECWANQVRLREDRVVLALEEACDALLAARAAAQGGT